MRITIEVTDADAGNPAGLKSAAMFLLHLAGETGEETPEAPKSQMGSSTPTAVAGSVSTGLAHQTATAAAMPATVMSSTTPTAPAGNVVNFPVPPPPPSLVTTAAPLPSLTGPDLANAAAAVIDAASVVTMHGAPAGYDSAGMPWDARIHNKGKTTKRDGTWKLRKLMNATPAQEAEFAQLVQTVTKELMAHKIATPAAPSVAPSAHTALPAAAFTVQVPSPPPPPGAVSPPPATVAPQVFLPDTNNEGQSPYVPMSTSTVPAAPATVPAPVVPAAAPVPVPPVAPAGPVGVTYRTIVDKATEGTRTQKLTAQQFIALVQAAGCPNLQQLNQMPNVWADVDARLDLALAGL